MNNENSSLGMLKSALSLQGFTFNDLTLGTPAKNFTAITSPRGNTIMVGSVNPTFPFNTYSARLIASDKLKAYDYAKYHGVATPKTILQSSKTVTDEAVRLLEGRKSVIVKPKKGSGSKGLTLDITDVEQLKAAIANAKQYHEEVIIQEQFFGEEIRFVIINGKAEAAILREKPRVIGDGKSTVAELIHHEEEQRKAIHGTQIPYPTLHDTLPDKSLFTNSTVLSKGAIYELGKGTMIRTGASMYNIISTIHPDYIKIAEKLTAQLGKGFIAVDIMVADYLQPASDRNYAFIEFNLAPALALFYSCRDGNQFNVIEDFLLDMIKGLIDWPKK